MDWVVGVAIYYVIWWIVLFMALPWGVRPIEDEGAAEGHAPSAPRRPRILLKMAITTVVAGVVWAVVYVVITFNLISLQN
jgi:predicted secreted protein